MFRGVVEAEGTRWKLSANMLINWLFFPPQQLGLCSEPYSTWLLTDLHNILLHKLLVYLARYNKATLIFVGLYIFLLI